MALYVLTNVSARPSKDIHNAEGPRSSFGRPKLKWVPNVTPRILGVQLRDITSSLIRTSGVEPGLVGIKLK